MFTIILAAVFIAILGVEYSVCSFTISDRAFVSCSYFGKILFCFIGVLAYVYTTIIITRSLSLNKTVSSTKSEKMMGTLAYISLFPAFKIIFAFCFSGSYFEHIIFFGIIFIVGSVYLYIFSFGVYPPILFIIFKLATYLLVLLISFAGLLEFLNTAIVVFTCLVPVIENLVEIFQPQHIFLTGGHDRPTGTGEGGIRFHPVSQMSTDFLSLYRARITELQYYTVSYSKITAYINIYTQRLDFALIAYLNSGVGNRGLRADQVILAYNNIMNGLRIRRDLVHDANYFDLPIARRDILPSHQTSRILRMSRRYFN